MKTVLKRFIKRLAGSRFRPVLKQMFIVLANAEYRLLNFKYMLQGCRMPDTTAQQYVRENVTFMYKSFERQPMARQLCKNIHKYYPGAKIVIADDSRKPLLIPHLTKPDDRHTVVAKSQNTYLARTDKIRQVGWDDNIRMIDHNEFFYRAAGVIVSTIAPDAVLFHRHNPFEGEYTKFRGDFLSDLIYIRAKHSSGK